MSRIHWVPRQNKLETPEEEDEVNKREVHECDGRALDPDAMVAPPTPNPSRECSFFFRSATNFPKKALIKRYKEGERR